MIYNQNDKNTAPIMGVSRHRMLSDGHGVRSLIAFYGCPLQCSYCLNPSCHSSSFDDSKSISAEQLIEIVMEDSLYFEATGGGLTFGGGEPLLYPNFIRECITKIGKKWSYACETSLNIPVSNLEKIIDLVDEFIVDIKSLSPAVYKEYTERSNNQLLSNLRWIADKCLQNKFFIRIPHIPNHNTSDDVNSSKSILENMGFSKFEIFEYVVDVAQERKKDNMLLYNGMNWGKVTCEVLKQIRRGVAQHYNVSYEPNHCHEKFCESGDCPACKSELKLLNEQIYLNK